MISRFVILCILSKVLLIDVSSSDVLQYHVNHASSDGLLNVQEIAERRKNDTSQLNDFEDKVTKIDDPEACRDADGTRRDRSEDSETAWFDKVPVLPVAYARSSTLPEGPCKKQAQRYLRDLKNGTLWATQSECKR